MRFLRPALAVASALVLAAHFLRSGEWLLVGVCLGLPLLLMLRRAWAVRLVQAALVLGGIEWFRTMLLLVRERQALGVPWDRMALILVAVALVTTSAAFLLRVPAGQSGGMSPGSLHGS